MHTHTQGERERYREIKRDYFLKENKRNNLLKNFPRKTQNKNKFQDYLTLWPRLIKDLFNKNLKGKLL